MIIPRRYAANLAGSNILGKQPRRQCNGSWRTLDPIQRGLYSRRAVRRLRRTAGSLIARETWGSFCSPGTLSAIMEREKAGKEATARGLRVMFPEFATEVTEVILRDQGGNRRVRWILVRNIR